MYNIYKKNIKNVSARVSRVYTKITPKVSTVHNYSGIFLFFIVTATGRGNFLPYVEHSYMSNVTVLKLLFTNKGGGKTKCRKKIKVGYKKIKKVTV